MHNTIHNHTIHTYYVLYFVLNFIIIIVTMLRDYVLYYVLYNVLCIMYCIIIIMYCIMHRCWRAQNLRVLLRRFVQERKFAGLVERELGDEEQVAL